jgi:hypothetical protein
MGRAARFMAGVTLAAAGAPGISLACSVCGAGNGTDAWALLRMTIVMSLVPLGLIGGAVYWVYRRASRTGAG